LDLTGETNRRLKAKIEFPRPTGSIVFDRHVLRSRAVIPTKDLSILQGEFGRVRVDRQRSL